MFRLNANDSSAKNCPAARTAVNNHWPKWSPDAKTVGSRTYYWLIYSSNRYGLPTVTTTFNGTMTTVEISQLYMTAVVVERGHDLYQTGGLPVEPPPEPAEHHAGLAGFNIPIVVDKP